jgi:PAS domain S-box-containing protein
VNVSAVRVAKPDQGWAAETAGSQLLDLLPAAVYVTDAAGRITYYNEAAAALWGCRPELGTAEFCGSWKLYRPDGTPLPHDQCPMALALKQRRAIRDMEAIAERPDGTRVPFLPYPTPLFDAGGALVGAVNLLVDISERKRTEQILQQLAAIVESSDDSIVSTDVNGVIVSWNKGAERLFGYSADEIIGKSITTLIPPDRQNEEPRIILERIRRGERIEHYETVRRRKDGTLVDISLSISPVKDVGGSIVGASKIARNITERKRAEAERELLAREIHHRTKNLFAIVQSIVRRSFADKRTVEEAQTAVLSRLQSMAQTHFMLIEKEWAGADIADVVRMEMSPYAERVTIEGSQLMLNPKAAQNFALALHELATNAVKYGALSNRSGRVGITWHVLERDGAGEFLFRWQERGGPRVEGPTRKGFGSVVLEHVMGEYFGATPRIAFEPSGVTYELRVALETITRNHRNEQ